MKQMHTFYFLLVSLMMSMVCYADINVVPAAPDIKAKSYVMMDYASGKFIVDENGNEILPPASLTKIMTVYVVAKELQQESIKLTDKVLISEKAWKMQGSRMFIEVNKQVSVNDLLVGVIVQSGNDASVALAEYVSGTEDAFAQLMNQHAKEIGMTNTHFVNSTGLPDDDHYTTAYDLALLSSALIKEFPEIYKLHSIKEFTFNEITQPNRNQLLWRDPSVDGLKTGHTEAAGYCLVASAVREDMRLISVVMGTDSSEARAKATQSLLNYGYRFFETREIYADQEVVKTVKVWKGDKQEVRLGLEKSLILTYPRGQFEKLKATVNTDQQIIAPVNQGQSLGTLVISLHEDEQIIVPLIALNTINQGTIINRIKDSIKLILE